MQIGEIYISLKTGDIITFERTFKVRDVELFTEISGDEGIHDITPYVQGRIIIQGLLAATLPTKIGGVYNVLARTIKFLFLRPIFTRDTITCEVTVDKLQNQVNRTYISTSFICKNQNKKEILK